MIIFDENVEDYWIKLLSAKGYQNISIRKEFRGISDLEVVEIVREHGGLLIPEDKDFGELIFSHHIEMVAVLFIRYDQPLYSQIEGAVLQAIEDYFRDPHLQFITVSKLKVRTRRL